MDMRSLHRQKNSRERNGRPHSQKRGRGLWRRIASGALCAVMLCTSIGGTVTAAETMEDPSGAVERVEQTVENTPPVLDDQTAPAVPDDGDDGELVEPSGGEAPEELPPEEEGLV